VCCAALRCAVLCWFSAIECAVVAVAARRMEIRQVVAAMKHDKHTKKLTFLEWSCAVFKKDWEELHTEVEVRAL
jgi:hypothetical protein